MCTPQHAGAFIRASRLGEGQVRELAYHVAHHPCDYVFVTPRAAEISRLLSGKSLQMGRAERHPGAKGKLTNCRLSVSG